MTENLTEKLTITGNGTTFHDATDLTDDDHNTIVALLVVEITRPDVRRDDELAEGLKAALRAIRRVEAMATDAGWTPDCTERLGVVAGDLYGAILAEAAKRTSRR